MTIKKPTGTNDFLPKDAHFWLEFQRLAREIFRKYGYEPVETPIMEQTELFVRGIGAATDVVSKEMFSALSGENMTKLAGGGTIKNKSRLTLRPEGTAGVVRAALENGLVTQGGAPVKLMYAGPMFRAERPQAGRYRQFHQVGVECLGATSPTIDAEAIIMLMQFYAKVGIPASETTLLLNSMGCEKCRPAYREAVRAFMSEHAEELCETCMTRAEINPLRAFDCKNESCAHVMQSAPRITDYLCDRCAEYHSLVRAYLDMADVEYVEDSTLVRGLDYYTRTVFEVVADTGGSQNAIGGGGRYDKLAAEIGGADVPGLGFAIGYERCKLVLEGLGAESANVPAPHLFVVSAGGDSKVGDVAFCLVQTCRSAGMSADMDHQDRSVKSQFKLANKLGAEFVVTLGDNELESGEVVCRNMNTHKEDSMPIDNVVEFLHDKYVEMHGECPNSVN